MESGKWGALALVALVTLLILRQCRPEWATFLRIAVAVVFCGLLLSPIASVLSFAQELGGGALSLETRAILLKALGVAFLTEVCAGICRDSGEGGLASWVEMAGRVEILLLALPLMREVLDMAKSLLGV